MNNNLVRDWYEDQENVKGLLHWNKGRLKIWEEKVITYFPAGSKILDIGCGLGREAFALTEKGYAVTGIDISETVINEVKILAKDNHYNIPFLHYNGIDLPFDNSSFDVVIIWAQTFGLLYGDEYKHSFLKECRRVLKDGGMLSFSGHDYEFVFENHKQYLEGRKFYAVANTEMYWETFLPEELQTFAVNAGFTVLLCEQGEIYKPDDGLILHCLCQKQIIQEDIESLVREVLKEYEFQNPKLTFIRHNENITYMVEDNDKKYVVRIRKPVEGFTGNIFGKEYSLSELAESEMMLIDLVRDISGIELQKPLRNNKGNLVSSLTDGSPVCVLGWIEGNVINDKSITMEQAKMLGVMVARLHRGFRKLTIKLKRISYTKTLISPMKEEIDDAEQKKHFPKEAATLMKEALDIVGDRMSELESTEGMAGIIHADLGVSNIIISDKGLIPIDFSLSGYGYYFMDVALLLSNFNDKSIRRYIKQSYEQECNQEVPITYIDAFFAFSVLLYLCSQHDKASREDWFLKAVDRWCNTIFQPLVHGEEFVL